MNNRERVGSLTETDVERFRAALESLLPSFGVGALTSEQIDLLTGHYSMLLRWNRRTNLTRITEPLDAARLHYCESLFGGRFINDAETILDVGSGAGFPAVPLAVLRPDLRVTALESNNKKSTFLSEAKDSLGLRNLEVATARIESFDRSGFDLLVSRALDRAEDILPPVASRLSAGQRLMLYCATGLLEKMLGRTGDACEVETHKIPLGEERMIALFSPVGQKRAG